MRLRDARPQRFCRLRTETAGTREKSKSLPHNKFTHVNAPAASGIPAAPYLGMTCHPTPDAEGGALLTLPFSCSFPAGRMAVVIVRIGINRAHRSRPGRPVAAWHPAGVHRLVGSTGSTGLFNE